ncbi:hypothetical protein K493DRAFT_64439 [Basidiobolus meristosporus CBS 931.73]|uniref:Uncharacterized protein n=1 Tax=Basidiobolus meristosporus CBS 931.73 TaxID=1314790 RepID=A0A1Y1XW22_9FUNG|nr:hypothetical protein K493DRAFT_64439 [Basidiobolus meristosporus CBS 931.73]|eukprot:ORX89875.1 hypothetical protein K493DRAFT_64439 [Basidiobolus meristosporus CBS 931.73]
MGISRKRVSIRTYRLSRLYQTVEVTRGNFKVNKCNSSSPLNIHHWKGKACLKNKQPRPTRATVGSSITSILVGSRQRLP